MFSRDYLKKRIKNLFKSNKVKKPSKINLDGHIFLIFPKVFNPKFALSSRFLMKNMLIKKGANVLDMGCGSGIQGIISFYKGAARVTFVDNNPVAIRNTKENIKLHSLQEKSTIIKSNFYKKVKGKFDLILFNSPFVYTEKIVSKDWISQSIFDYKYRKLKIFFNDSKKHLKKKGYILFVFCEEPDLVKRLNSILDKDKYKKETIFSKRINSENWVVYKLGL